MKVKFIIIHCTATPEGREVTAADVDRWHRQRGFKQIGYHYLIRLDGTVELGRPETMVGAHTLGQNAVSIGVCYVGGVARDGVTPRDTRTPAQRRALEGLVRDLLRRYPGATVRGHRDFAAKACPSFDATAEFRNFKSIAIIVLGGLMSVLASCRSEKHVAVTEHAEATHVAIAEQGRVEATASRDSMALTIEDPVIEIVRPDSVRIVVTARRAVAGRLRNVRTVVRDTLTLRDTVVVNTVRTVRADAKKEPSKSVGGWLLAALVGVGALVTIVRIRKIKNEKR